MNRLQDALADASTGERSRSAAPPGIHEIYAAALRAGLPASRRVLLSGLDPSFVAGLPAESSPGPQLFSDLNQMNGVPRLTDGSVPLAVWLKTAIQLVGPRLEGEIFRRALEAQSAARPAPAAPPAPAAAVAAPAAEPPRGPTRRAVRNLVNALIRTDSDLNAFCLDFFESVHVRFSNGMDRVAKVDLLLQLAQLSQIVDALRESYPGSFDQHAALLQSAAFAPPAADEPPLGDPALPELLRAYAGDNLILFVGAGVSAAAGLPSWKRLVERLTDRARARGASPAALQEIAELLGKERFIDALSAVKDSLGASDFGAAIEQQLDDKLSEVPEVATAIAGLGPRLRAVLTTNLDHLLERAFAGRWPALAHATGDIAQRRGYILKLHGTLLERSTWVFTREEYDRAVYADPKLQSAFSALFHACPILFVGYGLSDDDFDQVLARVRALGGDQAPRHFALAAAETITPSRQSRLERAGVRLIPYGNGDGKHSQVAQILRWLAKNG